MSVSQSLQGNLSVVQNFIFSVNILREFAFLMSLRINPNLGGVFRGLFFFFWGGGLVKLTSPTPHTHTLSKTRQNHAIILETGNLVRKYTHICSFKKYTF